LRKSTARGSPPAAVCTSPRSIHILTRPAHLRGE
jgi:hypothetical protein